MGAKLHEHSPLAGIAFDMAAVAAVQLQLTGRAKMTAAIRKLAPVLLEVIDDDSRI